MDKIRSKKQLRNTVKRILDQKLETRGRPETSSSALCTWGIPKFSRGLKNRFLMACQYDRKSAVETTEQLIENYLAAREQYYRKNRGVMPQIAQWLNDVIHGT